TQVALGDGAHGLQHHRADLRRAVRLAVDIHGGVPVLRSHQPERHVVRDALGRLGVELLAHHALDAVHGVFSVGHRLALGDLTYAALTRLRKTHNGRRGASTLGVGNDHRIPIFNDGDTAVRGSEVNPNDLAHALFPLALPLLSEPGAAAAS